jgi:DNA-binding transcriptional ArsR family regulator
MEIIMNPVRQRIIQYFILNKEGTTGEIQKYTPDIPPASLYRHMKILLEAGLIEVADENKVRGTVEKTYRIVQKPAEEMGKQELGAVFQTGLMSLQAVFMKYFSSDECDPAKDMLSFSTSTLMMTDEEFMNFLLKLSAIFQEAIKNKPGEGRKPRRMTLISSPCEEDTKGINK